jgi:hypothetical protein
MVRLGASGRYCESCRHAVIDLSALTEAQAERVLRTRNPDLCVSYLRDESGNIVFRKPQLRDIKPVTVAMGALLSLAACSRHEPDATVSNVEIGRAPLAEATKVQPPRDSAVVTPAVQPGAPPVVRADDPNADGVSAVNGASGPNAGQHAAASERNKSWPGAQSPAAPDKATDGDSCDAPPPKHTPKAHPPVRPPVRLGGKPAIHDKSLLDE